MRELFIFVSFFTFFVSLCAQPAVLLYESFENISLPAGWQCVDADADGHCWDAEYWAINGGGVGHTGDNSIASASYLGSIGALSPDNWLITPQILVPYEATILSWWVSTFETGLYKEQYSVYISTTGTNISDFTLLKGDSISNGIWQNRALNLSMYGGQNIYLAFRHHKTTNQFWILLDDIKVETVPGTFIYLSENNRNFDPIFVGNNSVSDPVNVLGIGLSTAITATVSAPFSLSTNGSSFASSVSLPATGGNLFVKYTPTTTSEDVAVVSLTSGTAANTQITVTGSAIDCRNNSLPYYEDFEDTTLCWTIITSHSTSWVWVHDSVGGQFGGSCMRSGNRFEGESWLITSKLHIPDEGQYTLSWYVKSPSLLPWTAQYGVAFVSASYSVATLAAYTIFFEESYSGEWQLREINLPAECAGKDIYLAFKHFGDHSQNVSIDNVSVNISSDIKESALQNFTIYPNPATQYVNIETDVTVKIGRAELYNMLGKLIKSEKNNSSLMQLSVHDLPQGIYFIKLFSEKAQYLGTCKMIKQ